MSPVVMPTGELLSAVCCLHLVPSLSSPSFRNREVSDYRVGYSTPDILEVAVVLIVLTTDSMGSNSSSSFPIWPRCSDCPDT